MIKKNSVVTILYEARDSTEKLLDKSATPLVYLHGGYGGIPAYLERHLEGHLPGDNVQVHVQASDGFGERDETLLRFEARDKLPQGTIQVGMRVEGQREDTREPMTFTVTAVSERMVTLDANHPLAGIALVFDVQVVEVRDASAEEISNKHAHGMHGHHH